MLVLHANWTNGALRLWGESLDAYPASSREDSSTSAAATAAIAVARSVESHSFTLSADALRYTLAHAPVFAQHPANGNPQTPDNNGDRLRLRLPRDASGPWPSDRLARLAGAESPAIDRQLDPWLGEFDLECLTLPPDRTLETLLAFENPQPDHMIDLSDALHYWIAVAKFIIDMLADQRFIPTLIQRSQDELTAAWQPWLHDDQALQRIAELLQAMPPIVRAAVDEHNGQPWPILEEAMRTLTDAAVRAALSHEQFIQALDDRDPSNDPHVAWLTGLLDRQQAVPQSQTTLNLLRDASAWVRRLDDVGQDRPLHLCLTLHEPANLSSQPGQTRWLLSFHLQSIDDPDHLIDADQIWTDASHSGPSTRGGRIGAYRADQLQESLLAELGRASRIYPKIESALSESAPISIDLSTAEAYDFLRDAKPLLEESGFAVVVPSWWGQPLGRLGARLHIEPATTPDKSLALSGSAPSTSVLGLNSLVNFRWQIAVGDQPLTMAEFAALANQAAPLVQVRSQWIEINPEQLAQARDLLQKASDGQMTLLQAIQIAHGVNSSQMTLPVLGLDAGGWVADLLGASSEDHRMPQLPQPRDFIGSLRPYQKTGLSWLAFLDHFGLGACLADDMGLGKTIQLIALLLHEREQSQVANPLSTQHSALSTSLAPTLLIVPTSVISNWQRELARFAPSLKIHVHHGPDRIVGDQFVQLSNTKDLVITTYPLISRDHETLRRMTWHRVALDEAQYIKNPPTKQTTAIRSLTASRRVALTGTPVENRLSELWSIMEFCNPGYLSHAGEFRRRFAVPIERHRDAHQADRLRRMVRPFILRRLKTDSKVINDLPELLETKEYATLTPEQAALYQQAVNVMLSDVQSAEGIRRRGLVLATLVKLKQICNHPATRQETDLGELQPLSTQHSAPSTFSSSLSSRSGKAKRLMTMLEEVLASGGKALIFTQFRQMGHLLTAMIQSDLDTEALFLHGGTPQPKRQHLIDRFQSETGGAPIFVLSLKAGGLGLNLTAANHVFHFDRWWNPAVENQATDRAFRIGQTRNVHVHKFVCVGTLEEHIDQMIEQKVELAQNIIGSGEQWLTELSTGQLHDLLVLRPSATEIES